VFFVYQFLPAFLGFLFSFLDSFFAFSDSFFFFLLGFSFSLFGFLFPFSNRVVSYFFSIFVFFLITQFLHAFFLNIPFASFSQIGIFCFVLCFELGDFFFG